MDTIRDCNGRFINGHESLPGSGFQLKNQFGKANVGNTYGKINKGRKAPWAKPPKNFGKKNCNWKGGITISRNGYVALLKPDHPGAHKTGYIRRHRLVAELCLGRYLAKREVIHHINKAPGDDMPINLYLFEDSAGHSAYHCLLKYAPDLIIPIAFSNLPAPTPEAKAKILDLLKV